MIIITTNYYSEDFCHEMTEYSDIKFAEINIYTIRRLSWTPGKVETYLWLVL